MRFWVLAVLPVCAAFAPYPSCLPAPSHRAAACSLQPAMSLGESEVGEGRRRAVLAGGASLLTLLPFFSADPASAFENRVEKLVRVSSRHPAQTPSPAALLGCVNCPWGKSLDLGAAHPRITLNRSHAASLLV